MAGEGGEDNMKTNINYFLEDFGISVNTGINMFQKKFVFQLPFSSWKKGFV